MPIPKIIHQIWAQGFSELPEKYKKNIDSVREKNPDFQIMYWDDNTIQSLLKTYFPPEYLEKYKSFNLLHQKIDFGRYAILYTYGGISMDTDAVALKSFNEIPFINEKDFIVSDNGSNSIENYVKHGMGETFINATILVSRNNPILKDLLNHILSLSCDINQSKYSCIDNTTGIASFTKYLLDNYRDKITILDSKYLDPCVSSEHCEINPSAVVDQKRDGTWLTPTQRRMSRMYYNIKAWNKEIVFVLIIAGVIILLINIKGE